MAYTSPFSSFISYYFILYHQETRLTINIEYDNKIPTCKERFLLAQKIMKTPSHLHYAKRKNQPTHTCINIFNLDPTILYPLGDFLCCLCSIFVSTKCLGTFPTSTNSFTFNIFPATEGNGRNKRFGNVDEYRELLE